MLGHAEMKVVRRMVQSQGVIDDKTSGQSLQVFPNGDRRRRSGVFWVEKTMIKKLLAEGAIERKPRGYEVTPSLVRRVKFGKSDGKAATATGQHFETEERDVFIPGGSMRKASVNRRSSVLERLARKRSRDGKLILTAAEVEAGRRLAKDYALAGAGHVSAQNYDAAIVDGGRRNDAQEDAMLARMTASTRLKAARLAMGEGLESAVMAVCCRDESLESVERTERWVKSSGLTILKIGLNRLVTLYGTDAGKRTD